MYVICGYIIVAVRNTELAQLL